MQRDNDFNEHDANDDEGQRAQIERIRPQNTFKRTNPPKRRGGSVSYNGIHRRRKKRVNW